jgi:hypothetical protein
MNRVSENVATSWKAYRPWKPFRVGGIICRSLVLKWCQITGLTREAQLSQRSWRQRQFGTGLVAASRGESRMPRPSLWDSRNGCDIGERQNAVRTDGRSIRLVGPRRADFRQTIVILYCKAYTSSATAFPSDEAHCSTLTA